MVPPSLTSLQGSRRPTTTTTPPPPLHQPTFSQELHASGLFALLLQPRHQLYGSIGRPPKPQISEGRGLLQSSSAPAQNFICVESSLERLPTPTFSDSENESDIESNRTFDHPMGAMTSTKPASLNKTEKNSMLGKRPGSKCNKNSDQVYKNRKLSAQSVATAPNGSSNAEEKRNKKKEVGSSLSTSESGGIIYLSSDDEDHTPEAQFSESSAIRCALSIDTDRHQTVKYENPEIKAQLQKLQLELDTQTQHAQELEAELRRVKDAHAEQLQALHQEHEEKQQKATNLLIETQSIVARLQMENQGKEKDNAAERSTLAYQLTEARAQNTKLETVVRELEVTASNVKVNHDKLQEKLEAVQDKQATERDLHTEIASLRAALEKGREENEEQFKSLEYRDTAPSDPSSESAEFLVSAKFVASEHITTPPVTEPSLRKKFESLSERNRFQLLPSPSLASNLPAENQTKIENIRKTYIKVKRRYDNVHSVVRNLLSVTRSIDLSSFGEFGMYLKQLRMVVEEEAEGQQQNACQPDTPKSMD